MTDVHALVGPFHMVPVVVTGVEPVVLHDNAATTLTNDTGVELFTDGTRSGGQAGANSVNDGVLGAEVVVNA